MNAREILTEALDEIEEFDKACAEAQYTDTGAAWEVFETVRWHLKRALGIGRNANEPDTYTAEEREQFYQHLLAVLGLNQGDGDDGVLLYDFDPGTDEITPENCPRYVVVQRNDEKQECRYPAGDTLNELRKEIQSRETEGDGWWISGVYDLHDCAEVSYQTTTLITFG